MTIPLDRRIDATIVPPHPWRSALWRCIACPGQPLGGNDPRADLGAVMAATAKRDEGVVFVRDASGTIAVCCDANCLGRHQRQVERGLAQPVTRIEVKVAPTEPAPTSRAWCESGPQTRDAMVSCAQCGHRPGIKQTLTPAGTWSPTPAEIEQALLRPPWDWRRGPGGKLHCSLDCDTRARIPTTAVAVPYEAVSKAMQASTAAAPTVVRQPVAVERLADASYARSVPPPRATPPWPPPNAVAGPTPVPLAAAAPQAAATEGTPKAPKPAKKGAR